MWRGRIPSLLKIELLRNFAAIADVGAISHVANRVGLTQAALSQQLKRLEEDVQQPLMIRSARGVTLTPYGERLLQHAHKILRAHDEAVSELLGEDLSGTIRFGCPEDFARAFLPPLLQSFSRQHPQVIIEVTCAPSPRLKERLNEHKLDLAILSYPDQIDRDDFLRRDSFVWVGAKGSDAANREPLQVALSDPDTLDYQTATTALDKVGRNYRIAYASSSMAGLSAVVLSGQAVSVLTQTAVPTDLRVLPPSNGLPKLPGIGISLETAHEESWPLLQNFSSHVRFVLPSL